MSRKISIFVLSNINILNPLAMRKDTTIISELQEFFLQNDSYKAINRISDVLSSLRLRESQIGISKASNCKLSVLQVFQLLVLFPFFGVKDAFHYNISALGKFFNCQKDMFYSFMKNDAIDWRKLLYIVSLQLIDRIIVRGDSKKSKFPVCLVADDTDLAKTGRRIELIGKIYSHVLHMQRLGFKGLFLMRTDGKTQTMLDFSLHGEEGKNPERPQGMSKKELDARYSVERDKDSHGAKRVAEHSMDKQTKLREMIVLAIKKGIRFDYLLVDSWFTCTDLVRFIKGRHIKCHFLGMIKMGNTKYTSKKYGELTAKGCIDKLQRIKKGIRYSRALNCWYGEMDVELGGMPVKLFFCKRGKHGNWNGLLTTNTELDFFEAYRIYSMRWAIEVSFNEMKGLLRLGKCEGRNFTEQIASISLVVIQYNILGLVKRFNSYETIGGLFAEITSGTTELSVVERLWALILEVVTEIAAAISADYVELMEAALNGNSHLRRLFMHEYSTMKLEICTSES